MSARRRTWLGAALTVLLACLGFAPGARAEVTQSEIDAAVKAGAAWLRTQQSQSGLIRGFNGDWATTTLAAAGINAADVRGSGALRSLQDYWAMTYAEPEWAELPSRIGPGQIGKAALIGWSAGLQPTRISAEVNLAADLASIYDPATGAFGGSDNTNVIGFALLGMPYMGFPAGVEAAATDVVLANQHTDGGWTYEEGGSTPGDIDMTGAALAMVCSNGYGPGDPRVAAGLQFLRGLENETTGALEGQTPGIPAINAPSIAWALIGIQACGEDPQGPNWTTPANTNPIEYVLHELVITSGPQAGSIRYVPTSSATDPNNVNGTEAMARALSGHLFSADPPPREIPTLPAVRPAPSVAAGTTVPIALTIEGAGATRMCAVKVPSGTPLVEALRSAETSSVPAGCVGGVQAQGPWVTSLDGVAATDPAGGWVFSTPGSAERRVGPQPVGFGDVVRLRLEDGPLPGALYATPGSIDFGALTTGGSTTRTFTVGDAFASVHVDSLALSGSSSFAITGDDCTGRTLATGANCAVTVRYAPTAAGPARGTLTVNAAGAAEPTTTVPLAGTATALPAAAKPRPPRITPRHGVVKVRRNGIAVLARLACPVGSRCRVQVPRRVGVKIAGRRVGGPHRLRAAVLAPRSIAPGASALLRLKLPSAAAEALRGHTAKLRLKVRLASATALTSRSLRVRLRGRPPRHGGVGRAWMVDSAAGVGLGLGPRAPRPGRPSEGRPGRLVAALAGCPLATRRPGREGSVGKASQGREEVRAS
ncbi:MAG TPA: choice-of-anchor D domain-containing protein, partial [Solirubrobacterales bacterium]|nr:choice-of-anchor D domain-containing protein [Solirubrobacterales bacterium]